MTVSESGSRAVTVVFAMAIIALVVDLIFTLTDGSAWPAFVLALVVFLAGGAIWLAHKQRGDAPPVLFGAWMLCLSALAWSIGLLAG